MSEEVLAIDFESEIERFKPSLEVEDIGEAIVKSDLTDMSDIMIELLKRMKE
ncbi:hypothetical protein NE556_15085 [[Clostridium] symbiosum]|uniref:hypothetical protein n=1 Tax=Clostridium symbiosum TaxID=1512 RepID=UPI00210AFD06|nr:hypothetical protein [[Clostridium] symbiosum]MCQ4836529.1 hypothetical protein [[Clostridium] symbiosum]